MAVLRARLPTAGVNHPPCITSINSDSQRRVAPSAGFYFPHHHPANPTTFASSLSVASSPATCVHPSLCPALHWLKLQQHCPSGVSPYPDMTDNLLVPLPCHYAAIRLNPTAMLKDLRLDDAITLAEAENFKPRTYLAFLLWVSGPCRSCLPFNGANCTMYESPRSFLCPGCVGADTVSSPSAPHCVRPFKSKASPLTW